MDRLCKKCGEHFDGQSRDTRCSKCRKIQEKILREKICTVCGKTYETCGTRSVYCPECSIEQKRLRGVEFWRRKSAGKVRAIGSKDICASCGCVYTVSGGLQRFCTDCAKKRKNDASLLAYYNGGLEARKRRTANRVVATANCIVCGRPFPLDGARDRCCSEACLQQRAQQLRAKHREEHPELYKELWESWYAENKEEYLRKKKFRVSKESAPKEETKMKEFRLLHGTGESRHLLKTCDPDQIKQAMLATATAGVGGIDCDPETVATWPEEQEAAARAELARHRCTYRVEQGHVGKLITADEWALAFGEVDEDGWLGEESMDYAEPDYILPSPSIGGDPDD